MLIVFEVRSCTMRTGKPLVMCGVGRLDRGGVHGKESPHMPDMPSLHVGTAPPPIFEFFLCSPRFRSPAYHSLACLCASRHLLHVQVFAPCLGQLRRRPRQAEQQPRKAAAAGRRRPLMNPRTSAGARAAKARARHPHRQHHHRRSAHSTPGSSVTLPPPCPGGHLCGPFRRTFPSKRRKLQRVEAGNQRRGFPARLRLPP